MHFPFGLRSGIWLLIAPVRVIAFLLLLQTPTEINQLGEISSKLTLILKAKQDLTITVIETNYRNSPVRIEAESSLTFFKLLISS